MRSVSFALKFDELGILARNGQIRLRQQALNDTACQVSDEFRHSVVPFFDPDNDRRERPMDTASGGVKPLRTSERVTKAHTAERVSFALQAWGRDKSAPIARVQQIAGVDRKTAAAWYRGKSPPQSEHLLTLARRIPELKGEVRRLLCMEADLDPEFQRAFTEFVRTWQR